MKYYFFLILAIISTSSITTAAGLCKSGTYDCTQTERYLCQGNVVIDRNNPDDICFIKASPAYLSLLDKNPVIPVDAVLTGTTTPTVVITGTTLPKTPIVSESSSFEDILSWAYMNQFTVHNSIALFLPQNTITRAELAKFINKTADYQEYKNNTTGQVCLFGDMMGVPSDLIVQIQKVCSKGLMIGGKGLFTPNDRVTKEQLQIITTRLGGDSINTIVSGSMTGFVTRGDVLRVIYMITQGITPSTSTSNPTLTSPSINTLASGQSQIGLSVLDDPVFGTALMWMYRSGITKFWKSSEYQPFGTITREQGAKFLAQFHRAVYVSSGSTNPIGSECTFTDITNSSYQEYIQYVCQYGILKGGNGKFTPSEVMQKAQFVAGLLNMVAPVSGTVVATADRRGDVFARASKAGIVGSNDSLSFDKPITRYEIALLMHKIGTKKQLTTYIADANKNISIIAPVTTISPNTYFIDINSIDNKDFVQGYINLSGKTYKIAKKQTNQIMANSYVRYGEIQDAIDSKPMGIISLTIAQRGYSKVIIEGYLSLGANESSFTSIKPSSQIPYYDFSSL